MLKATEMTQIHSYLSFNGNCREAMQFYKDCFGGELTLQTIGESPLSDTMPQKMKDCILHATLKKESLVLMATDMVVDNGLLKGNNVSLSLSCANEDELISYYTKLSAGGKANHLPEISFWGALFGDVTDKFGNHWLLSFSEKKNQNNS